MMRRRAVRIAVVVCACASAWAPERAYALDADVQSDSAAQFYDVRSPTGEQVLNRRRVTTTLAVSGYEILDTPPNDPYAPELLFRARLRYDADYGQSGAESDNTNFTHLVPGLQQQQLDLMYGYIEGRKLARGWLGFKLGRQYVTDMLGWYSFDGGEFKVTTPAYFAVEAYGGLEVRGGMPLSTSRFQSDGIWRGDRTNYDASLYPSYQPSDVAPVIGAAIESAGVTWLHSRLTYRRAMNTGSVGTSEFASGLYNPASYSGTRVSSEKLGYSIQGDWAQVGSARAGLVYDLYDAKFANLYANLDAFVAKGFTVGLDYQFYQPTFDADSIWNIFMSEPLNDIGLRSTLEATDKLAFSAGGHARIYTVQTSEAEPAGQAQNAPSLIPGSYFPTTPISYDGGGDLQARYRYGEGSFGARGSGSFGSEGDRVGGDLTAERIIETHYVVHGRVGLWQWNDKLRPDRDATDFGYMAGVGYRMTPRSQAMADFQQDMNRLVGQRFRFLISLTLAVTK
jgi:hypothetical protein